MTRRALLVASTPGQALLATIGEGGAEARLGWIREWYDSLRAAKMPDKALELLEDLFWWSWAAKAARAVAQPQERGPMTSDMADLLERHRAGLEVVLGPDWKPGTYASLERDHRFGDRLVRIYEAILPSCPPSPRRPPARRAQPIAYSRLAARLTVNLVNTRLAGWGILDAPLVERDVIRRAQARRSR